ncbi:uncharacterized protein LTR77_005174 [Saxophila tyrrhenica]|uniref:Uncharacterized protein n=1 Tax=Saxophila tyrrhenica TaxID=1690608 RepID=A0AAV9PB88_9PEZI|nr:hypothetical protein LTR77_005174 [Saxophila tyrrhenica]
MDGQDLPEQPPRQSHLLSLPAELRVQIFEYIFHDSTKDCGLIKQSGRLIIDDNYDPNKGLAPLLVCHQMYRDSVYLGLATTNFIIPNLFGDIPQRLSALRPKQIESVRNVTFMADARQFRKLMDWRQHPFDMANLQLDTLTIVLHRSSFWHYLFDYTEGIVKLLRKLQGVRRLVIVRNDARVKGSLKTWYNRLVGLILKVDHHQRYEVYPPCLEDVWWTWSFNKTEQTLSLEAKPSKPLVDEDVYFQTVLPLMEDLRDSVENEEWNPDPRSRYMYY